MEKNTELLLSEPIIVEDSVPKCLQTLQKPEPSQNVHPHKGVGGVINSHLHRFRFNISYDSRTYGESHKCLTCLETLH